jgi:hypothetical protein
MLVGGGVFVGKGVGVLVSSGVLVGTGVAVGVGLAAHPLIARISRPKIANHKRVLSSVFCIYFPRSLISAVWSFISEKQASEMPAGRRITGVDLLARYGKWLSGQ